ncbi:MAG: hypothetical protein WBX25_04875 [Rhodomicrobium sp.]
MADILACPKRGQKNRVPNRPGTAKCARCKEVIAVNPPRSRLKALRWPLQALAIAGALVWAITFELNRPESPRATSLPPVMAPPVHQSPEPKSKPALTPVEAKTGYYKIPIGPRLAPLTIRTKGPYNFFVRLYDKADNIVAEIYVRGSDTFSDKMSLGSYTLRYASGTAWYGRAARFGEDTVYSKALESFDFQKTDDGYVGYTIDLYRQPHGNLATAFISEDEFGD